MFSQRTYQENNKTGSLMDPLPTYKGNHSLTFKFNPFIQSYKWNETQKFPPNSRSKKHHRH